MCAAPRGPWHIDEDRSQQGNITIKNGAGLTVARVPFASENQLEDGSRNDHAEAMLIVNAPLLLTHLENALRRVHPSADYFPGNVKYEWYDAMVQAVKSAGGNVNA